MEDKLELVSFGNLVILLKMSQLKKPVEVQIRISHGAI